MIRLHAGTWENSAEAVRAKVFGELVKLAMPVVKSYHSDLFHDATWLRENVNGPCEFAYLVTEYGTHLGEIAWRALDMGLGGTTGKIYRVRLGHDGFWWSVTITEVTVPAWAQT